MEKDVYICSKPLQYFNVRNIEKGDVGVRNILIILGFFLNAEDFFHKVKNLDKTWDEVLYFKSKYEVDSYLFFHPVRKLFVEVDKSFMYGILCSLGKFKEMYVFEEGFGSYRRDRFDDSKGLKRFINRCTGVGEHVGFSSFLTGQYLYLPELYKLQFPRYQKCLYSFGKPFVKRLKEELPFFLKLSEGYDEFINLKNKKIGIYLTNHTINESILQMLYSEREKYDCIYVKPHPHIRDVECFAAYGISVIYSNIMLEFLLVLLLENRNDLTLYHENSTSVIWFQTMVKSINMGEKFEEYDIVASYIQKLNL